jgi:hypothetical protein
MMRKIQLAIPSIAMLVFAGTISHTSQSQTPSTQTKTIAERLGYPADSKLLIVHADDLGVAHSVNEASIQSVHYRSREIRQHHDSVFLGP